MLIPEEARAQAFHLSASIHKALPVYFPSQVFGKVAKNLQPMGTTKNFQAAIPEPASEWRYRSCSDQTFRFELIFPLRDARHKQSRR
jgi:hypothetical protein